MAHTYRKTPAMTPAPIPRVSDGYISEPYLKLLKQFPPHPIKSEADLEAVQTVIDGLLDAEQLTSDQQDYLDVLGTLVQAYEDQQVPIPDLYGVDLLKALIAEFGFCQKDLVPIFKTESIVSAVLSGQRNLTFAHIEKLGQLFQISPAAFFPLG
jgi:HTH-type transcriptional regulator/antitoxin HigA